MKSLRITSNEDAKIYLLEEEVDDPSDTQVQVEVITSVVSPGTERAFILSMENTDKSYPRTLGYSVAGIVTKVGSNVKGFKPGDRVAGILAHRTIGNIEQHNLVHIPDGVTFEEAAFVRIGVIAMQAVRKARIELGEGVLVFGLGLIGQMAMQLAKANGALPIIGIDVVESKLELAKINGCTYTFDANMKNLEQEFKNVNNGCLPQVVIESTGFPEPIKLSLRYACNLGRVIILGSTRGNTEINFYKDIHKKGLVVIGAHISTNPAMQSYTAHWCFRDNALCFLNLLKEKRINVTSLISQKESFENFNNIYKNVLERNDDYITSVITWKWR
ncbi:MAG TPA: zinc-binding alcohol dehydrogenase [Tepidanaerobacter syntrophicus]|uniref:zinc-dependent alcohol dehydrogenase n=1 Tax=Tepidanaerobacter syntrophicus TaxID=224999 RepID=UPI001775A9C7|nr:zinc-binding alcohol dehydrogenase [Tepidanaerobacter syntrophicus]HHV82252.1 zinc-binding alcohol dehydrogenase [Tepidanaerobacter syntrophicus]